MKKVFLFVFLLVSAYYVLGQEPRLVLPIYGSEGCNYLEFSNDGSKIVSSHTDGSIKLWDSKSGKLLISFREGVKEAGNVQCFSVKFSNDGSRIIAASIDGEAEIWNVKNGTLIKKLKTSNDLYFASFNSNGEKAITAGYDSLRIWDVEKGNQISAFSDNSSAFVYASFCNNGKYIFSISNDGKCTIWNIENGKEKNTFLGYNRDYNSNPFNSDSTLIVTSNGKYIEEREISTGQIIGTYKDDKDLGSTEDVNHFIYGSEYSKDDKKIICYYLNGKVVVWDRVLKKQFLSHGDRNENPGYATFAKSSDKIFYINSNKLEEVDIQNGSIGKKAITKIDMAWNEVFAVNLKLSQDGNRLISYGNKIKIWDIRNRKLIVTLGASHIAAKQSSGFEISSEIMTISPNCLGFWEIEKDNFSYKMGITFSKNVRYALPIAKSQEVVIVFDSFFVVSGTRMASIKKKQEIDWITGGGVFKSNVYSDKVFYHIPNMHDAFNYSLIDLEKLYNSRIQTSKRSGVGYLYGAEFSPDGALVALAIYMQNEKRAVVKIIETSTGKLVKQINHANPIDNRWGSSQLAFSYDNKKLAIQENNDSLKILNIRDEKILWKVKSIQDSKSFKSVKFSPDNSLISISGKKVVRVIDSKSGVKISDIENNKLDYMSTSFAKDSKLINVLLSNGTCELRNIESGELQYSFFAVDSINYFVQIPTRYYKASLGATKLLHYVTNDLKVITFEQLDVKYNRPDKVLEAIGNTDTALINSYRKAWEKRIKKLGIDTTQFRDGYSVPEADFKNRDNIEYEQKNGTLQLHIKGVDSTYKLDRFNIWVNEAPLFGQRGISIRNQNENNLDTIITIQLSQGENRIETSITNVNGTESYRMPLYVNYTPTIQQQEMAHFIGIGIDKFVDTKFNLQYSSKDIRDLAIKLKEKYKENIIIDTLFNENVTTANVKKLKAELLKTSVNDKVIVSYSGHGLLSKDYDYYLSTYSVNFNKPEQNGLPYDELENLLDSIPARKKLMLIDACHSGEVDKEEMQRYAQSANKLDTGVKGAIKLELNKNAKLGMKNSFELMQNLFVNVGKSTGATIISAAAGTQFALERSDLKNGVFTYCILEEMKKNIPTTISQLKKIVGEQVEKMTNGLQKPTSRNENIAVDWKVW